MKRITYLILGIFIGILLSLLYIEKQKTKEIHQQSNIILENIKNMNKMIVSEAYFNQVYSFSDTDKYLFDMLNFDKNVVLLVNARAQVSYDLNSLKIELDSIHKIIKISNIPKEEISIIPDIKYFNLEQSSFNSFTKDELNDINRKAIKQIKESIDLTDLKKKAKKQLFKNLQNIYALSKIYGWKVEEKQDFIKFKQELAL